jgi:2'-5' RNA ligase
MPRLFTALEVPQQVGQSLAMLRGGLPGARWIEPESYHVTLRFIGDIDDALAREIAYSLELVRRRPFTLKLNGLHAFGGKKPRAVVALVAPSQALTELQAEHERIMQRVGLPPEGRKYTPHVTLARLRDTPSRAVADYLALRGAIQAPAFEADQFVLYSAKASVGGGPYVVEAAYPLGDAGRQ